MIFEAAIVGIVIYSLTYLVQDAKIFDPLRERLRDGSGSGTFLDRMLDCSYCTAIYAGLFLALGDLALTLLVVLGAEFWVEAAKRIVAWVLGGAIVARAIDPAMFLLHRRARKAAEADEAEEGHD